MNGMTIVMTLVNSCSSEGHVVTETHSKDTEDSDGVLRQQCKIIIWVKKTIEGMNIQEVKDMLKQKHKSEVLFCFHVIPL